jgi:hypothetical protein
MKTLVNSFFFFKTNGMRFKNKNTNKLGSALKLFSLKSLCIRLGTDRAFPRVCNISFWLSSAAPGGEWFTWDNFIEISLGVSIFIIGFDIIVCLYVIFDVLLKPRLLMIGSAIVGLFRSGLTIQLLFRMFIMLTTRPYFCAAIILVSEFLINIGGPIMYEFLGHFFSDLAASSTEQMPNLSSEVSAIKSTNLPFEQALETCELTQQYPSKAPTIEPAELEKPDQSEETKERKGWRNWFFAGLAAGAIVIIAKGLGM